MCLSPAVLNQTIWSHWGWSKIWTFACLNPDKWSLYEEDGVNRQIRETHGHAIPLWMGFVACFATEYLHVLMRTYSISAHTQDKLIVFFFNSRSHWVKPNLFTRCWTLVTCRSFRWPQHIEGTIFFNIIHTQKRADPSQKQNISKICSSSY